MTSAVPSISVQGRAGRDETILFDGLHMDIGAAEWTCLLGPSGVGKSTLLRLLAGLDTHVDFTGTIRTSDGIPLAGRVSYMAQSDLLLPWATILENVSLGSRLRGEQPDRAKLHEVITNVGLADHIHKRPAQLSGGQRQRAALARTLMEDTPVVLLDEPFSSLDARTSIDMQELVARHLGGRTILLVTHDPGEAVRLCHQIYVLHQARAHPVESLSAPFPKDFNDPDVFAMQNDLMTRIRGDSR
jgi:putative hydroxymethylpyrimidine transport system ATP-binding protein